MPEGHRVQPGHLLAGRGTEDVILDVVVVVVVLGVVVGSYWI